jgi:hypothetical protein
MSVAFGGLDFVFPAFSRFEQEKMRTGQELIPIFTRVLYGEINMLLGVGTPVVLAGLIEKTGLIENPNLLENPGLLIGLIGAKTAANIFTHTLVNESVESSLRW